MRKVEMGQGYSLFECNPNSTVSQLVGTLQEKKSVCNVRERHAGKKRHKPWTFSDFQFPSLPQMMKNYQRCIRIHEIHVFGQTADWNSFNFNVRDHHSYELAGFCLSIAHNCDGCYHWNYLHWVRGENCHKKETTLSPSQWQPWTAWDS